MVTGTTGPQGLSQIAGAAPKYLEENPWGGVAIWETNPTGTTVDDYTGSDVTAVADPAHDDRYITVAVEETDHLTPEDARTLAIQIWAAADAAEGKPIMITTYRASAAHSEPGILNGEAKIAETTSATLIKDFIARYEQRGCAVIIEARIWRTLTDVSSWYSVDADEVTR